MAKKKLPSTIKQQVAKLRERGCIINDEKYAEETLKYINYFRLSNYFKPFCVTKDRYEDGTTFEKIMRIYEIDRRLRSILLAALEEIEIALRAAISNFHSLKYGAQGYLNAENFDFRHNHSVFVGKIRHLVEANDDREFVKHYNSKHSGDFPLWVIMELFSFGTLAFFYKDMHNADKKELASSFYGCTSSELDNWIFCMNELRNYCAHYNRLYGNTFPVQPKTPRGLDYELQQNVFGYMMIMKQVYHNAEDWNTRVVQPVSKMIKRNADIIRLEHIGFPENWEEMLIMQK